MACIKVATGPYQDQGCLFRLIHEYIYPKAVYIGGMNIDPKYAAAEMEIVKGIWMQKQGVQLWHFILSFSEIESAQYVNPKDARYIAYEICEYFADKYQIVFGIHAGPNLHIHFVINSVSFWDGKRYSGSNMDFHNLRKYTLSILSCPVNIYYN